MELPLVRTICRYGERERGPAALLLDRAEELAAITGAVDSAVAGAGSALLVEGAAGIGKTSLLARALRAGGCRGHDCVRVGRAEFEGGYAWGVVRELFQPEVRGGGDGRAGDAAALAAPALGQGADRGGEDSFSVLHGLYWLTAVLGQQGPLLLAVDDLHWADQPSLRFIVHMARLEGLAVLLVLTVRKTGWGRRRTRR